MEQTELLEHLREVCHPGRGNKDIVSLGMVQNIETEGNTLRVTLGFPKHRDPLTEYLVGATRACLVRHLPEGVNGEVRAVVVEESEGGAGNDESMSDQGD